MEKFTGIDYVDFRNCQNRYGQFSWSKNDSNYLGIKIKVFNKSDNKPYRLVQMLTMEELDFNHYKRLRNQLVIGAKNFGGELNLPALEKSTTPRDMDEQFQLAHSCYEGLQCKACHVLEIH